MPPRFGSQGVIMRLLRVSFLTVVVLVRLAVQFGERGRALPGMSAARTGFVSQAASSSQQGAPVRVPDP